jgi:alpha-tubulin suppressor-like RCC1 family protein
VRTENLRLWFLAILTVVVGSWWQLPSISALSIDPDGDQFVVYAAGWSNQGHLGVISMAVAPPRALNTASDAFADVIDADMGTDHTLLLRANGSVWSLGSSQFGQLGLGGNITGSLTPTTVPGLPVIKAVAAGTNHSLALDEFGDVWAWGSDAAGQLGLGNPGGAQQQSSPQRITTLSSVVGIAAGTDFSVAVTSDGKLWAWGDNSSEQLGLLGPASRNLPGVVPTQFPIFFTRVAAGGQTALALTDTGNVFGWGSNANSQIAPAGAGPKVPISPNSLASHVIDIAVGGGHIVLVDDTGHVLARGLGTSGQLGVGSLNISPSLLTVPGLTNIVDVSAGSTHSVAVAGNGAIYAWGGNKRQQLGVGSPAGNISAPVQVTGVPMTGRKAAARADSTLFLNAPGLVNVTTAVPLNVTCQQPFTAAVSVTGFNTVKTQSRDIVLVLDESGSIGAVNFAKLQDFASDFVAAQDMTITRIGVVLFASDERVVSNLTNNAQTLINAIQNSGYHQGSTCIGCGVDRARLMLNAQAAAGSDRTIIVVTDGVTTQDLDPNFNQIIQAAQASATLIAVGVGPQVSASQIDFIASDIPGVQTAFFVADFQTLSLVLNQLAVSIEPGIRNLLVSLVPSLPVVPAGPFNATAGNISSNGGTISWVFSTLGANTETLYLPLRTGAGGAQPVFSSISYESTNSSPQSVPSPITNVFGCPATIVLNPPTAQHFVGEFHNGSVNLLDDFGKPLSKPLTVQVIAGPNAGRTFNVTPNGVPAQFVYSSNASGIDELLARLPGTPVSASAMVAWEPTDQKAPTLSLPPDITTDATSANGSPVNFTVTALDDTDTTPTVDCSPSSGSIFPVGVTLVTCTATDDAHNSAQGTFNVNVKPLATILSPIETSDVIISLPNSPLTAWTILSRPSGINAPLKGQTIRFTVTGPSGTSEYFAATATNGQATLTIPVDQRGNYQIAAQFTGSNWLTGSVATSADAKVYSPTGLSITPPGLAVAGAPAIFTARLFTHNFVPIANQTVRFSFPDCSAPAATSGITDAAGEVSVTVIFPEWEGKDCAVEARFGNAADFFTSVFLPPADTVVTSIVPVSVAGSGVTLLPINPGPNLLFAGDSLPVSARLERLYQPVGPVSGETLTFTLTGGTPSNTSTLSAITDALGIATVAFPLNARGLYTVRAAFAGSSVLSPHSTFPSGDIYVFQHTSLVIQDVQDVAGNPTAIKATLTQLPQGTPAAGWAINLSSPGQFAMTAQTDGNGVATIVRTFPAAGIFGIEGFFEYGDGFFLNRDDPSGISRASGTASIAKAQTAFDPFGVPAVQFVGNTIDVSTVLKRISPPAGGIVNAPVTLTLTGPSSQQTSTSMTQTGGAVAGTFQLNERGPYTVTAAYAGDPGSDPTSLTGALNAYQRALLSLTTAGGIGGITLTARLSEVPSGAPLVGQTVHFSFGGAIPDQSAVTDAAGAATVTAVFGAVGTFAMTASFDNTADYFANHLGAIAAETVTTSVTVTDTIPPVISRVTPSQSSLWPANHQMVPITLSVAATDNLGSAPVCTITGITSNEPQNGLGDGDTPNDWLITGPLSAQLRAERAGNGSGRIYTVTVRCVDLAGNAATSSTRITVPKSQGK